MQTLQITCYAFFHKKHRNGLYDQRNCKKRCIEFAIAHNKAIKTLPVNSSELSNDIAAFLMQGILEYLPYYKPAAY